MNFDHQSTSYLCFHIKILLINDLDHSYNALNHCFDHGYNHDDDDDDVNYYGFDVHVVFVVLDRCD